MTFYSPFFLLAFLPVSASVYYSIPFRLRNIALCVFNLLFYYFAAGKWFFALPLCCALVCILSRFRPAVGIAVLAALFCLCKSAGFLPLGISFFFFRAISFLADSTGERSPVRIFAYLLFFPAAAMGRSRATLRCTLRCVCPRSRIFHALQAVFCVFAPAL